MCSQANDGLTEGSNTSLHLLLVPLMAQGRMIPMLDLARLFAARGVFITFVITPVNLTRIQHFIERSAAVALPIRFVELNFPAAEVGLPDGCENVDQLPSADYFLPFMNAHARFREPLLAYLRASDSANWPRPSCIVSDNLNPWTADIASSLGIPRIIFLVPSCFYIFCSQLIQRNKPELEAALEAAPGEPITLPGLPHPIRVRKHQVVQARYSDQGRIKFLETVKEAEKSADGLVVNSFAELEPWYLERYHKEINKNIWSIGPLSLYKEERVHKAARGGASSINNQLLFQWLDKQKTGTVVFVSFGSIALNTVDQIIELGYGLEASGRPFVWVVKEVAEGREAPLLAEWLADLDKRLGGRGILIRGWAPQVVILEHAAIGGFVTHCGWNSMLESVASGVVMATWPHSADQFLNERLVVDVLGVGVAVGVEEPTTLGMEGVVQVRQEQVEKAIESLMGCGEKAKQRRERARVLKEKARRAMVEGGSSWKGLQDVITYVSYIVEGKHKT